MLFNDTIYCSKCEYHIGENEFNNKLKYGLISTLSPKDIPSTHMFALKMFVAPGTILVLVSIGWFIKGWDLGLYSFLCFFVCFMWIWMLTICFLLRHKTISRISRKIILTEEKYKICYPDNPAMHDLEGKIIDCKWTISKSNIDRDIAGCFRNRKCILLLTPEHAYACTFNSESLELWRKILSGTNINYINTPKYSKFLPINTLAGIALGLIAWISMVQMLRLPTIDSFAVVVFFGGAGFMKGVIETNYHQYSVKYRQWISVILSAKLGSLALLTCAQLGNVKITIPLCLVVGSLTGYVISKRIEDKLQKEVENDIEFHI